MRTPGAFTDPMPFWLAAGVLVLLSGPAGAQNWLDTRIEIAALINANDYAAAAELTDTFLEQVRVSFGETSPELGDAHLLVAVVQANNASLLDAEGSVLTGIEIHEGNEGPLSTRLIEPYITLGQTYHLVGEYELALGAYNEARNIGRRAYGLLHEDQLGILDLMSQSAYRLGGFDEARELQLEAIDLTQRAYGEDSVEFLDAHYRYAEWLRGLRRYGEAERTYFSMQRMISRAFDDDPIQNIRLLRVRAINQRAFSAGSGYSGDGGMAGLSGSKPSDLEKALELARSLEEPDPVLEAVILRDIGDWNVAYGRFDEIAAPYEAAWQLLDHVEGGSNLQLEWFSDQTVIHAPAAIYSPLVVNDPDAPSGHVEIGFTIDASGHTRNVEIVSSEPDGVLDYDAARQIMTTRFRPRIEDGTLVSSSGAHTWHFRYDPERARRISPNFDRSASFVR